MSMIAENAQVTEPTRVDAAVEVAMARPTNYLRAMFEAVYSYRESRDPAALIAFADAVALTVAVRTSPEYDDKALAEAAGSPSGAAGVPPATIFAEFGL